MVPGPSSAPSRSSAGFPIRGPTRARAPRPPRCRTVWQRGRVVDGDLAVDAQMPTRGDVAAGDGDLPREIRCPRKTVAIITLVMLAMERWPSVPRTLDSFQGCR